VFNLSLFGDIFDSQNLLKDGGFEYVASAMTESLPNILCYVVNDKYLKLAMENKNVSCIIIPESMKGIVSSGNKDRGLFLSSNPEMTFIEINNFLCSKGFLELKHTFGVSKSAQIGERTYIGEKVYIGKNVVIGKNCIINDGCIVNDNCIIGDNVSIGHEGLYFKRDGDGRLHRVMSSGGVVLEESVEVLTGSSVQKSHDLGCLTKISEGSKISVNVNVGHSAQIGKHTLISGNVQVAGRATIGDYCWVGTSSVISDSISIGDYSKVRIGSVVVQNIDSHADVSGNFAYSHITRLRNFQKTKRGLK